jgi:hypothetical protein
MGKSEEYIVAYINILGTAEKIREDADGHLELLEAVFEDANKRTRNFSATPTEDLKLQFKMFSDNFLVSVKYSSYSAIMLSTWIAFFQACALEKGFLARGAVAQGQFRQGGLGEIENFVYGEALLEAVSLEAKNAIYPRVILSPKIQKYPSAFIEMDSDGLWFIDFLPLSRLTVNRVSKKGASLNVCTQKQLLKLRKHILSLHEEAADKGAEIKQKYWWLISQYNAYCKKMEQWPKEFLEKNMSFDGCCIELQEMSLETGETDEDDVALLSVNRHPELILGPQKA